MDAEGCSNDGAAPSAPAALVLCEKDARLFVYTDTAGLAWYMGHKLKMQAEKFSLLLYPETDSAPIDAAAEAPTSRRKLRVRRAVVHTSSLRLLCSRNHATKCDEPERLSDADKAIISERMLGQDVLDVAHFPLITFDVTHETETGMEGVLQLHGVPNPASWTKRALSPGEDPTAVGAMPCELPGRYLSVTCGIKQEDYGITPYGILGGTLRVYSVIELEVQLPYDEYREYFV